jgi:NTE family protein
MRPLLFLALALLLAGCATQPIIPPAEQPAVVPPLVGPPPKPIRIGLALGGGAARGFAHIGVIKVLEAQGIVPDYVAGTSAGAVVGALYAGGLNGFELQKTGLELDENTLADISFPHRGILKGEALQDFVNRMVGRRPLEKLAKPFAAVATDLENGTMVAFRTGNTGMAVRASSTCCCAPSPSGQQHLRFHGLRHHHGVPRPGFQEPHPARPDHLHILNVAFLVPDMRREFGGCAGNIAYT